MKLGIKNILVSQKYNIDVSTNDYLKNKRLFELGVAGLLSKSGLQIATFIWHQV